MALESIPSNRIQKKTFRNTVFHDLKSNLPFIVAFCLTCIFFLILPSTLQLINDHMYSEYHQTNTPVLADTVPNYAEDGTANVGGADGPETVYNSDGSAVMYGMLNSYRFGLSPVSIIFFPAMAFLLALLQSHYLTNKRAMDVYGALPIKREALAGAKLLSGILILLIPTVISYLIILIANLIIVGFSIYLFYEFCIVVFYSFVLMLIPYSLVLFVSSLSGTITENIIYPGVFIFSPILIYSLVVQIIQSSIFGFAGAPIHETILGFLFPYISFFIGNNGILDGGITNYLLSQRGYGEDISFFSLVKDQLLYLEVWLILCAIILTAMFFCLKRRKNERAGQKRASLSLNIISCFLTCITAGLSLLTLLNLMNSPGNIFYDARYILFILATVITFIIYQLIVMQSVSAVLHAWKQYLASLAVSIFFIVFLTTNAFGIYLQVPDPDNVESVSISYRGLEGIFCYTPYTSSASNDFTTSDPELIQLISDYHQSVLDDKSEQNENSEIFYGSPETVLTYFMKDGTTRTRNYESISQRSAQLLIKLTEHPEFIKSCSYAFQYDFHTFNTITLMDPYKSRSTVLESDSFDLSRFQQALQTDILEETWENYQNPDGKELGMVYLEIVSNPSQPTPEVYTMMILIKPHYTNTIEFLNSAGLMDYFAPDYSNIQEIALVSRDINNDGDKYNSGYFGNMNPFLSLFSKTVVNTAITAPDEYDGMKSYYFPETSTNFFNDPEKIKSILDDCYNQHSYSDSSSLVYVRTGYALNEMILP